jgi:hypothetical protein
MQDSLAIALAWPNTKCKQTGAWYDKPAGLLGINKDNYYKVGHSAIVLINPNELKCHYFDFGRYHAPKNYGRVRDEITDHELKIFTKPKLSKHLKLENYQDIIDELQTRPACHGDGQLYAGLVKINFTKAYNKAKDMQNRGVIEYGPFVTQGTNCSRFVRTIILSSNFSPKLKLKLKFTRTISPTPIGIVYNLSHIRKANISVESKPIELSQKAC